METEALLREHYANRRALRELRQQDLTDAYINGIIHGRTNEERVDSLFMDEQ